MQHLCMDFKDFPKDKARTDPKPLVHLNYQDALALATRMHKAWQVAKENIEKAQQRMQTNVNQHRSPVN
ncbi:hypothetical protein SLS61_010180 [Didymella pomorum]